MVSQGSGLAHTGMVHAAKILTATAVELFAQPELLERAKEELVQRREGKPYVCPIPEEVALPFLRK
jgi:aminobenzoyl-glutamate utilization protein B